jgi:hypothetical protein
VVETAADVEAPAGEVEDRGRPAGPALLHACGGDQQIALQFDDSALVAGPIADQGPQYGAGQRLRGQGTCKLVGSRGQRQRGVVVGLPPARVEDGEQRWRQKGRAPSEEPAVPREAAPR